MACFSRSPAAGPEMPAVLRLGVNQDPEVKGRSRGARSLLTALSNRTRVQEACSPSKRLVSDPDGLDNHPARGQTKLDTAAVVQGHIPTHEGDPELPQG